MEGLAFKEQTENAHQIGRVTIGLIGIGVPLPPDSLTTEIERNNCVARYIDPEEPLYLRRLTGDTEREHAVLVVWLAAGTITREVYSYVQQLSRNPLDAPIIVGHAIGERDRINLLRAGAIGIIDERLPVVEIALRIIGIAQLAHILSRPVLNHEELPLQWMIEGVTLAIDTGAHKAYIDDTRLHLTETEWRILVYMAQRHQKVCSREAIITECMDYQYAEPYLRSLDAHIKNLRRKLGNAHWIETARRYGYQFAGEPIPR